HSAGADALRIHHRSSAPCRRYAARLRAGARGSVARRSATLLHVPRSENVLALPAANRESWLSPHWAAGSQIRRKTPLRRAEATAPPALRQWSGSAALSCVPRLA